MRLLTWITGVTVAIATVLFAVSNHDTVAVTLWPFPFALDLGLYAIVLISVLAGFVVGTLVTWLAAGKHRRRVRKQRAEIRALEKELDGLRGRLNQSPGQSPGQSTDKAA